VQDRFETLVGPNFPARTKLLSFDWLFYGFGFFLLILPFLPFPNLKFTFLLLYLFFFVGVFAILFLFDFRSFLLRRTQLLFAHFRAWRYSFEKWSFSILPSNILFQFQNPTEGDSI